jgi:lysophospholipid acyltransferase (LPLAT)-like uncharacterized protein
MSDLNEKSFAVKDLSPKARRIGWAASLLIRLFAVTFRWKLHDPAGLSVSPPNHPMIWIIWHNRVFVGASAYKKYLSLRKGAVLSSASRDGEIIAATVSRFGCAAVRGSSSRRGATALLGLIDWIKAGYDVLVVPDGPRGPCYRLAPGVVKLAQLTDAKILPIRVEYGSCWKFKSWDRFQLPKPFTTVSIYFEALESVPEDLDDESFEKERQRIERIMNPNHETD